MTIVVFCGPTIAESDVRAFVPEARILPPVAQGDVLREAQAAPTAIVIIDGYFEGVPSVWHKEILWALSRGIRVLGASSMGALRAAELAGYGMVGHGEVFRLFASGEIEDDDEVAVTHGPSELGYPVCSEAMVNIRATLAAAQKLGVLSISSRGKIEGIAKSLFFADRTIDEIVFRAKHYVDVDELQCLHGWWNDGHVDLKKRDAIDLFKSLAFGKLRMMLQNDMRPSAMRWHFEPTLHWEQLRESVGKTCVNDDVSLGSTVEKNYDLSRSLPSLQSFADFVRQAAQLRGMSVSPEDFARVAERVCLIADLRLPGDVDAWLHRHGYTMDEFRALIVWVASLIRLLEDKS